MYVGNLPIRATRAVSSLYISFRRSASFKVERSGWVQLEGDCQYKCHYYTRGWHLRVRSDVMSVSIHPSDYCCPWLVQIVDGAFVKIVATAAGTLDHHNLKTPGNLRYEECGYHTLASQIVQERIRISKIY